MQSRERKKLFIKKKTVSYLSDNQMDKILGATGDECFSETCPGDRGCDPDPHTSNCPPSTFTCPESFGCPPETSDCPPTVYCSPTDLDCGVTDGFCN